MRRGLSPHLFVGPDVPYHCIEQRPPFHSSTAAACMHVWYSAGLQQQQLHNCTSVPAHAYTQYCRQAQVHPCVLCLCFRLGSSPSILHTGVRLRELWCMVCACRGKPEDGRLKGAWSFVVVWYDYRVPDLPRHTDGPVQVNTVCV